MEGGSDSESESNEGSCLCSDCDSDTEDSEWDDCRSEDEEEVEVDINLIPTGLMQLQSMASMNVALVLINYAENRWTKLSEVSKDSFLRHDLCCAKVKKWTKRMKLPKPLRKKVKCDFKKVVFNLKSWIFYLHRKVFAKQKIKKDLYDFVNYVVWYPNGSINSKESARNLLKTDQLNETDKFRLACTYCIEEEIHKLWPTIPEQFKTNQVRRTRLAKYPLVAYWSFRCENRLNDIQVPENITVDEFMLRKRRVDNWFAKEYFFDQLDYKSQITNTVWFIDNQSPRNIRMMLSKLDESQRMRVYSRRACQIILKFYIDITHGVNYDIHFPSAEQCCLSVWYQVRTSIAPRPFLAMMMDLLIRVRTRANVMIEIWTSAPDGLKTYALNVDHYDKFMEKVFIFAEWQCKHKNCSDFVIETLLDCWKLSSKQNTIMNKYCVVVLCSKLVDLDDEITLDRLLSVGFRDNEKRTEFMRTLPELIFFENKCYEMVEKGQFEKILRWMNFFHPKRSAVSEQFVRDLLPCANKPEFFYTYMDNYKLDPLKSSYSDIVQEFKVNLFNSIGGKNIFFHHLNHSPSRLTDIISDVFPASQSAAEEFIEDCFSLPERLDELISILGRNGNYYHEKIKEIFDRFLSSESKERFKKSLKDHYERVASQNSNSTTGLTLDQCLSKLF